MIKAHINKISFLSGLSVDLASNTILVVVGPNNSGKSATLGDISGIMRDNNYVPKIINEIEVVKATALEEIKTDIASYKGSDDLYRIPGNAFYEVTLSQWWAAGESWIGEFLTKQLVSDLTTRARLADCDPASTIDMRADTLFESDHPFQRMYRDVSLETALSDVVRKAFKLDFVIHRAAGTSIPAYVGERPPLEAGENPISLSYLKRLEKLAKIEVQGDGIRSFVSIAGRVLTENRSIQLIDEPEAFLHPPQAKQIADVVASHGGGRQTILATHSRDILQGLLSKDASRVSVIRLTRPKGISAAHSLPSGEVAELWRDPILRFSNALDGLFHDGVIVTESDADCRFYEAMIDSTVRGQERPDLHYTYSGGKDRLPVVISALAALKVPVATLVDFDVLNAEQPLRKIIEAHGGSWDSIRSDWTTVKDAVEGKEAFLGGNQFRNQVKDLLASYGQGIAVPKEVLRDIKKLTRKASPWDNIKDSGLSAISSGEPTLAAKRLLASLNLIGVFVVPVGEMEGFCRSIGNHGPRWVEQVLKRDLAADTELLGARGFVADIVSYIQKGIS